MGSQTPASKVILLLAAIANFAGAAAAAADFARHTMSHRALKQLRAPSGPTKANTASQRSGGSDPAENPDTFLNHLASDQHCSVSTRWRCYDWTVIVVVDSAKSAGAGATDFPKACPGRERGLAIVPHTPPHGDPGKPGAHLLFFYFYAPLQKDSPPQSVDAQLRNNVEECVKSPKSVADWANCAHDAFKGPIYMTTDVRANQGYSYNTLGNAVSLPDRFEARNAGGSFTFNVIGLPKA